MSDVPPHLFSAHPALPPPVRLRLVTLPDQHCPYLPGRTSRSRAFAASEIPPELYHDFMDAGFRRSGEVIYQPVCPGCRDCVPIRVPVERFAPSRSQRRCWRRNLDLRSYVADPEPTDEKWELYQRYVRERHDKAGEDRESFEHFLYTSPVRSAEVCYRDPAGRLLAVGLCDLSARSLSTVYFYFDPAERRRGLGTFGVLFEIELARSMRIPYYYLGFWVADCRSMRYKADFRPCELLGTDGVWREAPPQA